MSGSVLVLMIVSLFLVSALGTALAMVAVTETKIAASYAAAVEARHGADAGLDIAMAELSRDWGLAASGAPAPAFADGPPGGTRVLGDGSVLDLDGLSAQAKAANPSRWLFAFGPLAAIAHPGGGSGPDAYVAVWVGDVAAPDPDVVVLYAEAFGPFGARRAVEAKVRRAPDGTVRMVSWWEVR